MTGSCKCKSRGHVPHASLVSLVLTNFFAIAEQKAREMFNRFEVTLCRVICYSVSGHLLLCVGSSVALCRVICYSVSGHLLLRVGSSVTLCRVICGSHCRGLPQGFAV